MLQREEWPEHHKFSVSLTVAGFTDERLYLENEGMSKELFVILYICTRHNYIRPRLIQSLNSLQVGFLISGTPSLNT